MNSLDKPVVMIGAGGHATVLADILLRQGETIVAVIDPDVLKERSIFHQLVKDGVIRHHRQDSDIELFPPESVYLVNGVGMMPASTVRKCLDQAFLAQGYKFAMVIADSAEVSPYAILDSGVQVLAGAIIQAGARIGAHSIINTFALVEHDSVIGKYNHLAPRATVCGQVITGDDVFIGAGATVIQGISLGDRVIVGAGAILTKDLTKDCIAYPPRTVNRTIGN